MHVATILYWKCLKTLLLSSSSPTHQIDDIRLVVAIGQCKVDTQEYEQVQPIINLLATCPPYQQLANILHLSMLTNKEDEGVDAHYAKYIHLSSNEDTRFILHFIYA